MRSTCSVEDHITSGGTSYVVPVELYLHFELFMLSHFLDAAKDMLGGRKVFEGRSYEALELVGRKRRAVQPFHQYAFIYQVQHLDQCA